MRFKSALSLILVSLLFLLFSHTARAQQGERFRMANHLMNQQKFEQAYKIYTDLLKKYPQVQTLYDRTVKCLVNMKQYEQAITLSRQRIQNGQAISQTSIRLGELYHLNGDTTRAFEAWEKVLKQNPQQLQTYLQVARSMKDRNEYERAIEIYQRARDKFRNNQLFANELAYTYQMAGHYEKAIRQYLSLIKTNPRRADFVKQSMMRFKDDYLYEVAVVEFDEFLTSLPPDHPSYRPIHNLYQWLLIEMDLFERALAKAKSFEQKTEAPSQILLDLGNQLLSLQKYNLAQKAFAYYRNSSNRSLHLKSLEKLGDVYMQWADYLSDYNIVYTAKRDSLYSKANSVYTALLDEKGDYKQVGRVLMKQAELALDHLKDADKAEFYLELMKNHGQAGKARTEYINGRIKLYRSEFDRARIAFTNSHNASKYNNLTEKSRYYLALTNFYSGDFEYAQLQLKALEKQSTSYFANDAVQLRMWMQDGMQQDSATAELVDFSRSMHSLEHGQIDSALQRVSSWLYKGDHPLTDDAVLALARHSRTGVVAVIYSLLDHYMATVDNSPLRERLMWERARIAEQIINDKLHDQFKGDIRSALTKRFKKHMNLVDPPDSMNEVQNLYEELLLEYPQGFYSSYARERIQQIENTQT